MQRPRGGRHTGKLALKLALVVAVCSGAGTLVAGALVVKILAGTQPDPGNAWTAVLVLAAVAAVVAGCAVAVFAGQIGQRVTELGMAVSKLGRGGTAVRVRVTGNDEITAVGRQLQSLATDLAELLQAQEQQGGNALVTMDPQVRQLRDKNLPHGLPAPPGYEVDGAVAKGSRGGLDYFDVVAADSVVTLFLISGEGQTALAVVAARLAFDVLRQQLQQGEVPRQALLQTNKALKQALPGGVCATATLLRLQPDGARLFQAGARSPLLICTRGEVLELAAEGIALGLDDGPVFEKALRPQEIQLVPGIRLCLVNDAALRAEGFLALLSQHSPRHTAMFMNMVLGTLEQDAGLDGLREEVVLVTAKKAGQA
ncbi:MAG TPA: SpoIIE family protein phosphatase [Planctomycetota bacterium]|nr:SpoIIE family protein phosphatase [Planctomycetota bacterium]